MRENHGILIDPLCRRSYNLPAVENSAWTVSIGESIASHQGRIVLPCGQSWGENSRRGKGLAALGFLSVGYGGLRVRFRGRECGRVRMTR